MSGPETGPEANTSQTRKNAGKKTRPKKTSSSRKAVKAPEDKQPVDGGDFPVVGFGASAGGLKALRDLLEVLPVDTGIAFVLIQHLSPTHESSLADILSRATPMEVLTAEDGQQLRPNTLSVIPPDFSLYLEKRRLRLQRREQEAGMFHPIDEFFISLANELQEKSIAVVLSGSSSDGAKGVISVRSVGGLTMAQSEASAEYPSMPHQALLTDRVDFCGKPAEIGKLLGEIASHPHLYPGAFPEPLANKTDVLEQIIKQLQKTGADFSEYKQSTVKRRILRRMAINRLHTLDDYLVKVKGSEEELKALREDLLIKVTSFFRDPGVFESLKKKIFPQMLEDHDSELPLRIWVPGCASGEEVYSLAICLIEFLDKQAQTQQLQFFGTDLSDIAIEKARKGLYTSAEMNDVKPRLKNKYFSETTHGLQIKKSIRDLCVFARQDFTQDPPFSRLNLISCRNVLIYLGPVLQKRVLPCFHYALAAKGVLLIGQSESIGQHDGLFSLVDSKARIYRKKSNGEHSGIEFRPSRKERKMLPEDYALEPRKKVAKDLDADLRQAMEEQLLRKYNPTAVVIDRELIIKYFRGDSGLYLQPFSGKASLELTNMVHDSLRMELRGLVYQAIKHQQPQSRSNMRVTLPVGERLVNLEVRPLDMDSEQQYYLIEFKSRPPEEAEKEGVKILSDDDQTELNQLKQDLAASHSYQQALLADKDRALEELKTANEEILSSNEELQSINEEMETAKEELESSNEELSVVNQELLDRNRELGTSQEDLNNLIASVDIPFVIVDKELHISRFNQNIKPYFNIRDADIGRPLHEINLGLKLPDFGALVEQVQQTGEVIEKEILIKGVGWKLLRINPYYNSEDQKEGAVLTLIDIDRLKQSMEETKRAYRYALNIVDSIKYPLLVLDKNCRVLTANPAFYQQFKVTANETEGKLLFDLGEGQWDNPELKRLITGILPKSSLVDDFLIEFDFPVIGTKSMLVSARHMQAGKTRILISIEDVTERLAQEEDLRLTRNRAEAASHAKSEFLATMSHEIRTPMTVILGALDHFDNDGLDEVQRRCLELAGTASKSLIELVDNVLDISKIEAERMVLENNFFDLTNSAEETVGILRNQARKKALDLNLEIESDVPETLRADQTRLRQVLTNLIGNAIKFTDEGRIDIRVSLLLNKDQPQLADEILFSIKDTGCGIPADKQSQIFQSFSQADSSINRRFGGTGLGLSICKGLVERMGGRIWVESEYGAGSCFYFTLPVSDERRLMKQKLKSDPPDKKFRSTKSCSILLAEDEPAVQEVIRFALEGQGWKVFVVSDGQAAIEALAIENYDLVLMDLQMSEMDGIAATQAIRSQEVGDQHLPIIGLTAHAFKKTREKCLQSGMDEVLTKPLDVEKLHTLIEKFCG